jgi:amino acid adenylation domain-containing protein
MTSNLTQSQLLMWTGQRLNPEAPIYNMALAFELGGPINHVHFQAAFQALVDRSDALRTVFHAIDGVPKQVVRDLFPYQVEMLDWTDDPDADEAFPTWAEERSRRLFDLEQRLFDSVLVKRSTTRFIWFFNQHHLITDAWSVMVLYQAMAELYQRSLNGTLDEAPELPSFQIYLDFEKNARTDTQMPAVINYWKEKLKRIPAPPRLYGEGNEGSSTLTRRVTLDLGPERSQHLRALAQEADVRSWTQHLSLFNIFAATAFAFLYRVSGQQTLAIGAPAHNRTTPDFKATPGVFIEVFPLIAEVNDDDSFGSLLQRVRAETFEFLRNAQPGAGRADLSRSFNVVLNYIHAAFSDFSGVPMKSEWIHPGHCDPRHLLRIQVHDFDASGNIQLHFDLNCETFDEFLQKATPRHFLNLLDAFLTDRSQSIGQCPLLSDEENDLFYRTASSHAGESSVIGLFEEQARRTPNATAIRYRDNHITYRELNEKADRLARRLQSKGVGPGQRIALYLQRSPELIAGIWGVLKTGAAYIPIAVDYPAERVTYMLEDAQAALLLTQSNLAQALTGTGIPQLLLDTDWGSIESEDKTNLNVPIRANTLAYLMYTSGSTGRPKGVMISHGALANYIQWAKNHYITSENPAIPLFTSIGFDLTVTSLFLPFVTGGVSVIYEESKSGPDLAIFQVLEDNLVDLIKLTPSHLALLKDKDLSGRRIRSMIVGGEDFKSDLAKTIQAALGHESALYNEYGPTEATVGCVAHRFDPENTSQPSVPIGKPITDMQAYVLDTWGHPVPQGVVGELFVSGAGLADGYWNQPELTRERFIDNPFNPGTRMYRTGDLVRLNKSGALEYLGRKDLQMKIGGIRIEPAEIETALAEHPGVQDCVVILRQRHSVDADSLVHHCIQCGLPANYPGAEFDDAGVCNLCRSFEDYQQKVKRYFRTKDDLQVVFNEGKGQKKGAYDCIMLLSGGKDSTYALAQLVEMGLKVLAFTLDNGFISEQAKANISRVVNELGVDHIFGRTPAMNDIFVDSLQRRHNVCDGCFKTIYTLSIKVALEKGIPYIVTGLSRGQFFETRLTEELFRNSEVDVARIDQTILEARKAYHRVDDAVKQLLDVAVFDGDQVFEQVQFIDFYRYCDVSLEDMLKYLDERLPWVRPTDTGRSTNCLINQAGIYIHKKERGYSNYAFPYSWDVRIGHKTREASLEEINEEIDENEVQRILREIGYTETKRNPDNETYLVAYYTGKTDVQDQELRRRLAFSLPDYMIPAQFIHLDALPLTPNGKVDRNALPRPDAVRPVTTVSYVAPGNEFEEMLAALWSEVLHIERIGVHDNFLELGGNSLAAIRLTARLNEAFHLDLPVTCIFEQPTIAALAGHIEATILAMLEELEQKDDKL